MKAFIKLRTTVRTQKDLNVVLICKEVFFTFDLLCVDGEITITPTKDITLLIEESIGSYAKLITLQIKTKDMEIEYKNGGYGNWCIIGHLDVNIQENDEIDTVITLEV